MVICVQFSGLLFWISTLCSVEKVCSVLVDAYSIFLQTIRNLFYYYRASEYENKEVYSFTYLLMHSQRRKIVSVNEDNRSELQQQTQKWKTWLQSCVGEFLWALTIVWIKKTYHNRGMEACHVSIFRLKERVPTLLGLLYKAIPYH
jgi:hypothetical protein